MSNRERVDFLIAKFSLVMLVCSNTVLVFFVFYGFSLRQSDVLAQSEVIIQQVGELSENVETMSLLANSNRLEIEARSPWFDDIHARIEASEASHQDRMKQWCDEFQSRNAANGIDVPEFPSMIEAIKNPPTIMISPPPEFIDEIKAVNAR